MVVLKVDIYRHPVKEIALQTASYYTHKGPGRVGITVGSPRGVRLDFPMYRDLAPTWDMLRGDPTPDEYQVQYAAILGKLDAQAVWDELHALTAPAAPVLLCFERPPFSPTNWCHRRLVAAWFKRELGRNVPELGYGMLPLLGEARLL